MKPNHAMQTARSPVLLAANAILRPGRGRHAQRPATGIVVTGDVMDATLPRLAQLGSDDLHLVERHRPDDRPGLNTGDHNQLNGDQFDFAVDFDPVDGWDFTLTPAAGGDSTVSWSVPHNDAQPGPLLQRS